MIDDEWSFPEVKAFVAARSDEMAWVSGSMYEVVKGSLEPVEWCGENCRMEAACWFQDSLAWLASRADSDCTIHSSI